MNPCVVLRSCDDTPDIIQMSLAFTLFENCTARNIFFLQKELPSDVLRFRNIDKYLVPEPYHELHLLRDICKKNTSSKCASLP